MIISLCLSTTILYISNFLHDGINIFIYIYIYRLIHSVNKNLAEHSEKLDDATKTDVQAAIDAANSVSSDADLEKLREAVSALSNASMKIGQAMYNKKGGDVDGGDDKESSGSEKKGKEAEYEEKK
jgi:molecular chaperone DnaK